MPSALVMFSGGQDSTTALAWALEKYDLVETIGFTFIQQNSSEGAARPLIRELLTKQKIAWRERLGVDHVEHIDIPIVAPPVGVSQSFVPGRNLFFLLRAAVVAFTRDIHVIVGGMCEADFSGFPDCRDDTIKAMQTAVNLGMGTHVRFETPIMHLSKSESWWMAATIGKEPLVELVREHSRTCYRGDLASNTWGHGCGKCDACKIRCAGWSKFCSEMRT